MRVSGTKFEMHIAKTKLTPKLMAKSLKLKSLKAIWSVPSLNDEHAEMDENKHKKKQTGMLHNAL